MPHRDFLPDYVPKSGDKPLVVIFPGIQLRVKNRRVAERYPSDREFVAKILKETGTVQDVQANLAMTGFLVPWVPQLLGFKVFGKGSGGILRCSLAGIALGLYAATYTAQVNSLKWKQLDSSSTLTKPQRIILRFHLSESNRIKQQVFRILDCQPPQPLQGISSVYLRKWIYRTQWEMWRWKYWWNIVYWPEEMERAWREAFTDEQFQKTTVGNWNKYLEIERKQPGGPNVPLVSFFIHKNVFQDLKQKPPGQIVRSAAWNLLSSEMQQSYAQIIMDNCKPAFKDHADVVERQKTLQKVAADYLKGGNTFKSIDQLAEVAEVGGTPATDGTMDKPVPSPVTPTSYLNPAMDTWLTHRANAPSTSMTRDAEFEKAFANEYKFVQGLFQRTTHEVHYCEEWLKVISGEFPNRYSAGEGGEGNRERAARHVLRMAEASGEEDGKGDETASGPAIGTVEVKDIRITGPGEKDAVKGKQKREGDVAESISAPKLIEITERTTETAAQPVATPPPSATSVQPSDERKEKKSITEAKKSPEEKGKQESGVENS